MFKQLCKIISHFFTAIPIDIHLFIYCLKYMYMTTNERVKLEMNQCQLKTIAKFVHAV